MHPPHIGGGLGGGGCFFASFFAPKKVRSMRFGEWSEAFLARKVLGQAKQASSSGLVGKKGSGIPPASGFFQSLRFMKASTARAG